MPKTSQLSETFENDSDDGITVVTVTRGRPDLLRRCIQNMQAQDFSGSLTHLVFVDDDEERYRPLEAEMARSTDAHNRAVSWHFVTRRPGQVSGPPVTAPLRNSGVSQATSAYVAFCDDDNLLERHHFSSLVKCIRQSGSPAAHSQRRMMYRDGTPYLNKLSPWKRNVEAARARYAELRRYCVYVPWSDVIRDQAHPRGMANRIQMVDMGEWLFKRSLLLNFPLRERYDANDWQEMITEDNKLLSDLVEAEIPIASTHMPTLHYMLGGMSNAFRADAREGTW